MLLALGALGAAMAIVMVRFATPEAPPADPFSREVLVGRSESFPRNTVTYVPSGQFFVVNWEHGISAFDANPEAFSVADTRCNVKYFAPYPEESSSIGHHNFANRAQPGGGHFKSDCVQTWFAWSSGEDVIHWCRCGLYSFKIQVRDDNVFVDKSVRSAFGQ